MRTGELLVTEGRLKGMPVTYPLRRSGQAVPLGYGANIEDG